MKRLTSFLRQVVSSWMVLPRRLSVEDTAVGHQVETLTGEMSREDQYLDRIPVMDVREVRYGGVSMKANRVKVDDGFLFKETRDGLNVDTKNSEAEMRGSKLVERVDGGHISRFAGEWTLREHVNRSLVGNGEDMARSVASYAQKHIFGGHGDHTIEETRLAAEHVDSLLKFNNGVHSRNNESKESLETLHSILGEYINYLVGEDTRDFKDVYLEGLASKRLIDMNRVKKRVRKLESRTAGKNYNFNSNDESGDAFDSITVSFLKAKSRSGNAYNVNFENSNGMYSDSHKSEKVYWSALDNMLGEGPGSNADSKKMVSMSIRSGLRSSGYYSRAAAA